MAWTGLQRFISMTPGALAQLSAVLDNMCFECIMANNQTTNLKMFVVTGFKHSEAISEYTYVARFPGNFSQLHGKQLK